MASNVRMKIAAGATVLGLGGLAGYALASNDGQSVAAGQAARDPKVHTEVVHRTIHVRPKGRSDEMAAGSDGATSGAAPPTGLPAVAVTPVSDTSGRAAPSTGTSGGSSSSDESEDYGEHESDDDSEQADDQGGHESVDYGEHEIEVGDD